MPGRKVFISYAREDGVCAGDLARRFEEAGDIVWMDSAIAPGERWDHAVHGQLKACDRLIVILSPESVASENVMDEVGYALDHGKEVVPVLLRDCEIPLRLRRIQYQDLRDESARPASIDRLLLWKPSPVGVLKNLRAFGSILLWTGVLTIALGIYFKMISMPLDPPAYVAAAALSLALTIAGRAFWNWRRRWARG